MDGNVLRDIWVQVLDWMGLLCVPEYMQSGGDLRGMDEGGSLDLIENCCIKLTKFNKQNFKFFFDFPEVYSVLFKFASCMFH